MKKDLDIENKLKNLVASLPDTPGVYQYLDKEGKIIYVGKAKNLKKRVSSYFYLRADHPPKLKMMVSKIVDIRHINVLNERDALLLENNLIKDLRPRYNISLKDDKSYPWLCISKEDFPRVYVSRIINKTKASYFGPYPNQVVLRTLLDFIEANYPIRTCKLRFSEQSLEKRIFKVCVKYHIKTCLGPCAKLQNKEEYNAMVKEVHAILNGYTKDVENNLQSAIKEASANYNFEDAHRLNRNLVLLKSYKEKTIIEAPTKGQYAAISFTQDERVVYASFIQAVDGRIIRSYTYHFIVNLEIQPDEILSSILGQVLSLYDDVLGVLLLRESIPLEIEHLEIQVPNRGDKLKMLIFAENSVRQYKRDVQRQEELLHPISRDERTLIELQKALGMDVLPDHIECFDNSNIQGEFAVAACVVFKDGRPSKKEYRHFNIKTVVGADDFASMEEIVYRRYSRLLNEDLPLPNLIVIDGGKGQVHAAAKSIEKLNLRGKIKLVGLAKRLEEIIFLDDPIPLFLSRNSEALKLMIRIRDEVHRFGIAHHRKKRSAAQLDNELVHIKGLGPKTLGKLRQEFGSIKRMMEADAPTLQQLIGVKRTKILMQYFKER